MTKMFWNAFSFCKIPFLSLLLWVENSSSALADPHLSARATSNSTGTKLVFAHFIAGLTINYTRTDWANQVTLAAAHGIDAFVLNVGTPADWQISQVSTAYDVAGQTTTKGGQQFKMFLSLDMSVIQSASDVTKWVTQFLPKPSQLTIGGRPIISTFSGEQNNLGGTDLSAGWQAAVKAPLLLMSPPLNPLFVPAWSGLDPTTAVTNNPVVDGIMTWKSWPTAGEVVTNSVDLQFQTDALKNKKLYMAGVSPCFFTHYSDKNFLFRSDDNLYITRWKELLTMPTQPDFIQIISWNDYGESHYIGPIAGTQPSGTTWVEGFDHQPWLAMTDYFIPWYKNGAPPAITDDSVYFQYRPHSVSAVATSDPLGPPTNASLSSDAVYAAVFLASNSRAKNLTISVGDFSQTFNNLTVGGISTFTAPWTGSGGAVQVSLMDDSGSVMFQKTGKQKISNSIKLYNFNYAHEMMTKVSGNAKKGLSAKFQPLDQRISLIIGFAAIIFSRLA